MAQKFYKGRTNNHLTWLMVDATDFATPESALSAATKIKIYGKLRGGTGTNFVSSGTGSLTNDITHVGASALGLYTIALVKADLSDASAAWYDQYIVSLSATGAAYQTIIVDGGIDDSALSGLISDIQSAVAVGNSRVLVAQSAASDAASAAAQANSRILLVQSRLSDLDSRLASDLSDVLSGIVALSGLVSDVHSAANVGNSRVLLVQSRLSDLDSRLASDVSDILSGITALSSLESDTHSAATAAASRVLLVQSRLSDLDSRLVSDISDIRSALSDAHSDLKSAIGAITVEVTDSNISDIASAVDAALASRLSDILSAAQQTNSRVLVVQSLASDAYSAAILGASHASDAYSAVLLVQSRLSDLDSRLASDLSDVQSMLTALSGAVSDAHSAAILGASHASDAHSAALLVQSRLSDLDSRLASDVSDLKSALSDIGSDIDVIDDFLDTEVAAILAAVDTEVAAIKAKTDNLPEGIAKNTALANFEFFMADEADHVTGKTGLTITAERSLDGGAFAAMTNAAAEVGNGIYKINLAAADTNCDFGTFKFTSTGADATLISFKTEA